MLTRRRFVGATLATLAAPRPAAAQGRAIVDGAGRRVEVPSTVRRVFAAGGPASIFVYTLAPDALLAWTRPPTAEERPWIPARYADLPVMGRLTGRGNTANVEVVLAARPDVVLDFGQRERDVRVAGRSRPGTDQGAVPAPGRRPVGHRARLHAGRRSPGSLRAGGRAGPVRRADAERRRPAGGVGAARAAAERVLRARPPGFETAAPGSINAESLDRLGVRNVAAGSGGGLSTVSLEQVLAWNPDVILTLDPTFHAAVGQDPSWRGVRAVREGHVHLVPLVPFPWVDFPPSVNRVIGLRWLGHVLYPDAFPGGMRDEARAFYGLFYHRVPDERQLDSLLGARP
jgi:iron complex transport system substrate-binding protein